jgi:hypothetical protein
LAIVDSPVRRPSESLDEKSDNGTASQTTSFVPFMWPCHSCQSMSLFIVFILSANCRLFLVLLSSFLQNVFHPSESSFLNLLFVAVACYLLRFFVLESDSHEDIIQFAVDFGFDFLLEIIAGSFYFPSFFPPSFWPIVACKFLLPFPILLD